MGKDFLDIQSGSDASMSRNAARSAVLSTPRSVQDPNLKKKLDPDPMVLIYYMITQK